MKFQCYEIYEWNRLITLQRSNEGNTEEQISVC